MKTNQLILQLNNCEKMGCLPNKSFPSEEQGYFKIPVSCPFIYCKQVPSQYSVRHIELWSMIIQSCIKGTRLASGYPFKARCFSWQGGNHNWHCRVAGEQLSLAWLNPSKGLSDMCKYQIQVLIKHTQHPFQASITQCFARTSKTLNSGGR